MYFFFKPFLITHFTFLLCFFVRASCYAFCLPPMVAACCKPPAVTVLFFIGPRSFFASVPFTVIGLPMLPRPYPNHPLFGYPTPSFLVFHLFSVVAPSTGYVIPKCFNPGLSDPFSPPSSLSRIVVFLNLCLSWFSRFLHYLSLLICIQGTQLVGGVLSLFFGDTFCQF